MKSEGSQFGWFGYRLKIYDYLTTPPILMYFKKFMLAHYILVLIDSNVFTSSATFKWVLKH